MNKLQETIQKEQNDLQTISRDFNRDIPIISITGTNGKTTTTRLIAYILSKAGYKVGMTTTDGTFINGNCVYEGDATGPRSALMVIASNKIDVAVLETARGGLVREGLAYDLADDHLGLDGIETKEGLQSFQCNEKLNPGRFNSFDINGVLTILDYGHNIDGYKRVLESISQIKHNRLIGVIGVPGDRLDRTTLEVGKIAGTYFNYIFIKEDKDRRGRLPGEVAELLRKGILKSGFDQKNLKLVKSRINSKRPELSIF